MLVIGLPLALLLKNSCAPLKSKVVPGELVVVYLYK